MRPSSLHALAVAAVIALPACAGRAPRTTGAASPPARAAATFDSAAVVAAERDWWRAFAVADTAYLDAHTARPFALTLSSGRTFDRAGMLAEAASYASGPPVQIEWSDESVRLAGPSVAVVTSRFAERLGATAGAYRYLTVLQHDGTGWRVSAAQSTRELALAPRVPASLAGALGDFAGDYRTPRGGVLRVAARDSALVLVDPSGGEARLEPVGPALFELSRISTGSGVVRFTFARDGAGRVTSLSRLASGSVSSFPRVP